MDGRVLPGDQLPVAAGRSRNRYDMNESRMPREAKHPALKRKTMQPPETAPRKKLPQTRVPQKAPVLQYRLRLDDVPVTKDLL